MASDGTLGERVSRLEERVHQLEQSSAEMRGAISELRNDVRQAEQAFVAGLGEVKDSLRDVVIGALNSMPKWAARSNATAWAIAAALAALIGSLAVFGTLHP